jgi:hypothetical protein
MELAPGPRGQSTEEAPRTASANLAARTRGRDPARPRRLRHGRSARARGGEVRTFQRPGGRRRYGPRGGQAQRRALSQHSTCHARPTSGYTDNLPARLHDHRAGHGSRLVVPALRGGIEFVRAATSDDIARGGPLRPYPQPPRQLNSTCRAGPPLDVPGKLTARAASVTRASTWWENATRSSYRRG